MYLTRWWEKTKSKNINTRPFTRIPGKSVHKHQKELSGSSSEGVKMNSSVNMALFIHTNENPTQTFVLTNYYRVCWQGGTLLFSMATTYKQIWGVRMVLGIWRFVGTFSETFLLHTRLHWLEWPILPASMVNNTFISE